MKFIWKHKEKKNNKDSLEKEQEWQTLKYITKPL